MSILSVDFVTFRPYSLNMVGQRSGDALDRWLSEERGRSKKLARALNISQSFVCDLRKSRRRPSLAIAYRIEAATGVRAESFLRPTQEEAA